MKNRLLCFIKPVGLMLSVFLFFATTVSVQAQAPAKATLQSTVSVKMENNTVGSLLNSLSKMSGIKFIFDANDLKELPPITHDFVKATIEQVLNYCFNNTNYKYSFVNSTVIIERRTHVNRITVFGTVTDMNKVPLPGASIVLKGTSIGVSADAMGRYKFSFAERDKMALLFSYVGSESREVNVGKSSEYNIMLKDDPKQIEDIVVNGAGFTREKSTFTGAVTTIKGEDLIAVSNTNIITALTALTPGLVKVENNAQGSNPNAIPEIVLRGSNSLVTTEQEKAYNAPLIILDGVEISMTELYDLDMYEIERVDVLKDASATIIYGDKAANGVIVIERYRVAESKVRLNYNFVPNFSIPEISSLNICNSAQKLELERLAGLYDSPGGQYDRPYAEKLQRVRQGVNTDWASAPLRTSFSHSHSLNVSGRGSNIEYRAGLNFNDSYGVMKGDNRRNYAMTFFLGYHSANKLTVSYRADFTMTDSKASPYGSFSQYSRMNPYEPVYDEYGDYIKNYYFDPYNPKSRMQVNPLYNASLSSFSKTRDQKLRNSIDAKWYITKLFFITGQFNVSIGTGQSDAFVSPDDARYIETTNPLDRGRYSINGNKSFTYDGRIGINYSKMLGGLGSAMRFNAGADIGSVDNSTFATVATGFHKDKLNDIKYALSYDRVGKPGGGELLRTNVGFFISGNYIFRNRYYADASYRTAGNSTSGRNNRFADTWAFGLGWNVHKEKFMANVKWINSLRVTGNLGYTGSVNFSPYMSMTTYNYDAKYNYFTGSGAVPITMGNPDLKPQRVFKQNAGISARLLNDRIGVSFDIYSNRTVDMLTSLPLPPSVGVPSVKVNFGEMINRGYEISLSGAVIKNKNFLWNLTVNGSHVMDKIHKVSASLKGVEFASNADNAIPKILFREGGSQSAIYAVRSAGIDPATGREIYIKLNGEYTYDYNSKDRVIVGNTKPTLEGAMTNTFVYKGFSLTIMAQYHFGSDVYNSTIKSLVEGIDPYVNVDARALTDRWKNPGDLSRYLAIGKVDDTQYSERFVEKDNLFNISNISLSYDFSARFLEKIGFKRLMLGFSIADIARFSNVKLERGIDYPYCRSFNISFRPTF